MLRSSAMATIFSNCLRSIQKVTTLFYCNIKTGTFFYPHPKIPQDNRECFLSGAICDRSSLLYHSPDKEKLQLLRISQKEKQQFLKNGCLSHLCSYREKVFGITFLHIVMEGFIGRPPVTSFSPKERRKIRIPQKGQESLPFRFGQINRHMFRHLQNFLYAIPSPRHTKGMIVSFHHGSVKSLTLLVILIILYQFFLQFQPNIYGYKKNKLLYNSRNTFCTAHSFQKQKFRIYLCALIGLRAPRSVGCHTVPPASNALLDPPYKPSLSKER